MYKTLTKYGQLGAFLLGLIVIVVFFISVNSGLEEFNAMAKDDRPTTSIFNAGIYLTLGLLIVCAVVAVLFGLYQMVTNPKGALKAIIALAVLAILFFALYSSSAAETEGIVGAAVEKFNVTDSSSKIISAGIKSTLILLALSVLAFVASEIRNFFK